MDFFHNNKMYHAIYSTSVILISKGNEGRTIKDIRPISCCTIIYKIISKILTCRMDVVMATTINQSQSAFVPRQNIHDHILLSYELIRGYNRKGGTPRCMLQIDT